ncbi:unnamed protein product, partial [Arabidopsis halleri]
LGFKTRLKGVCSIATSKGCHGAIPKGIFGGLDPHNDPSHNNYLIEKI